MRKRAEAFRSIGEVAKLIGVAPHVLRYWETQFSLLRPMKRPDGRRYYRHDDVALAAGLCEVLREEGLTIRGARKMMARDRGDAVRARGEARIEALLGSAIDETPAREPESAAANADAAAPDPLPVSAPADLPLEPDDPAEDGEDDQVEQVMHARRSRQRRRPHHATSSGPLPLFPDLDAATGDTNWLAHLATLAARLRDADTLPGQTRSRAIRLRDAISRFY